MSTRSSILLVFVALLGCGNKSEKAPANSPDAREAHQLFQTVCSTCHGADGKGDGSAAAMLNPKPRDYTQAMPKRMRRLALLGVNHRK